MLLAAVALVGCGDDAGGRLAEAFCADLRAGGTPMQIALGPVRAGTMSGSEVAEAAHRGVTEFCPEMADDPLVVEYLAGWGY